MSTPHKGVVQVVLPRPKKNGEMAWGVIVDGVEYYDSKGSFKDRKPGEEISFEWDPSKDGNIKFMNLPGQGGFQKGGGGGRGKSPEELALQRASFAMSYSKDLTQTIISNTVHFVKELPEGVKYLEFCEMLRVAAINMTVKSTAALLPMLPEVKIEKKAEAPAGKSENPASF